MIVAGLDYAGFTAGLRTLEMRVQCQSLLPVGNVSRLALLDRSLSASQSRRAITVKALA